MNKLKEIRKKLGITQQKLSTILKCPQSTICRYEKGIYKISLNHACLIIELCVNKNIEFKFNDLLNI